MCSCNILPSGADKLSEPSGVQSRARNAIPDGVNRPRRVGSAASACRVRLPAHFRSRRRALPWKRRRLVSGVTRAKGNTTALCVSMVPREEGREAHRLLQCRIAHFGGAKRDKQAGPAGHLPVLQQPNVSLVAVASAGTEKASPFARIRMSQSSVCHRMRVEWRSGPAMEAPKGGVAPGYSVAEGPGNLFSAGAADKGVTLGGSRTDPGFRRSIFH